MRTPEAPKPRRPYRDLVVGYAVLAALIVVVAAITGGNLLRAGLVAVACFVAASGWSWWRLRAREAQGEQ